MLTKAERKEIQSLQRSRERQRLGRFVCEGHKLVGDMLGAYVCELLVLDEEAYDLLRPRLDSLGAEMRPKRLEVVGRDFDFRTISSLTTPQPALAVFALPDDTEELEPSRGLALYLDDVQDPGNVGTLIRTADWFGLEAVYLSSASADPYSPKVLQATMGAMSRLRVRRLGDVPSFLKQYKGEIIGTFLAGESLYALPASSPESPRLLVLGNEGQGISAEVASYVTKRITIPPYALGHTGSESLNVAIAGAICLSELRRQETTTE